MPNQSFMTRIATSVFISVAAMSPLSAAASDYPSRPVTIVVPYAAGGTPDILARLVSDKAGAVLNGTFIVENRGGAGGNIGAQAVARSEGDGYTLLMCAFSCSTAGSLYKRNPPYNIESDFVPVIMIGTVPSVMVVPSDVKANTLQEFIALAKKEPVSYASSGVGTSPHLASEQLSSVAGIKLTHVPYKGAGQVVTDLLANRVQLYFDNLPAALPHIRSGKLRPLLVAQDQRSKAAPEIPTSAEAGLPDLLVTPWFGIFAPKSTPPEVVERLNAAFNAGLTDPAVLPRIAEVGLQPIGGSPEKLKSFIAADVAKWAALIADRNIVGQ